MDFVQKHLELALLKTIYEESEPVEKKRGVRRGDNSSLTVFEQVLEDVFKKVDQEERGIKICGQYLRTYNVILISDSKIEQTSMQKQRT